MLDAALLALSYADGRRREDLDSDPMLRDALLLQIQIIGEAAGVISEETCAASPRIPWRDMRGMRNRLVHEYFRVDLDLLWATVERDLPDLARELERLLE